MAQGRKLYGIVMKKDGVPGGSLFHGEGKRAAGQGKNERNFFHSLFLFLWRHIRRPCGLPENDFRVAGMTAGHALPAVRTVA